MHLTPVLDYSSHTELPSWKKLLPELMSELGLQSGFMEMAKKGFVHHHSLRTLQKIDTKGL